MILSADKSQDRVIPASASIPMTPSLGMSIDLDQGGKLVSSNQSLNRKIPLAINLSAALLAQAETQEEFDQLLSNCELSKTRLCIEASHHVLNQHPCMRGKVSERVNKHRHQFGIDNLDLGQSLQLLQSGQFDYVKINAETLNEMSRNNMLTGYQALRTITDTGDIQIIAVAVDSQEVFDELKAPGIDILQVNLPGSPEAI